MESRGGNPFLIDDPSTVQDTAGMFQQTSNPFLQEFTEPASTAAAAASSVGENPFLNFTAEQTYQPPSLDSTNPFANPFATESTTELDLDNIPTSDVLSTHIETTNIFQDETRAVAAAVAPDIFAPPLIDDKPIIKTSSPSPSLPSRPPPPKPPARNTKDLILSVTGAMDATSSQMLDRLQQTRTPSPTLMHSPSPTPEHSVADLLDVDSNVPDITDDDRKQQIDESKNILDIFDSDSIQTDVNPLMSSETSSFTGIQENMFVSNIPSETLIDDSSTASSVEHIPIGETTLVPDTSLSGDSTNLFESGTESTMPDYLASETILPLNANEVLPTVITEKSMSPESDILSSDANLSSVTEKTNFGAPEMGSTMFTAISPTNTSEGSFFTSIESVYTRDNAADIPSNNIPPTVDSTAINDLDFKTTPTDFAKNDGYFTNEINNFPNVMEETADSFDAFASKFDKAAEPSGNSIYDPFSGGSMGMDTSDDVWGDSTVASSDAAFTGFGESEGFDSFLSMTAPPQETALKRTESGDSDDAPDFSVYIKPKEGEQLRQGEEGPVPILAPPPKSPQNSAYSDATLRFNPFDKSAGFAQEAYAPSNIEQAEIKRTDSQETPPTPLFDEDVSQPLEDFPRVTYTGDGWEMQLRQPNKKKITGQRFWKKIFVRLVYQGDNPAVQLFQSKDDKDPFQELPLLPCYSVSEIGAQQFDHYGKIFTVKLQYIVYKERPGVRPGQVTKAERLTNKLSQFAAYAIQGDYQGVKEFGSDLKKLGLPVEHAPQISQLFKIGSHNYEDMKEFSSAIEEALFRLSAHRDRALQYKMEEVQISVVDELYVEQNADGHIEKQIARVRLFFLGFLSGMPDVELGVNDMRRQGKEVVGRHDIIPVVTEEWIRLENVEFHSCIQQDEFEDSKIIRFKPPDACYIELLRFRVRPPKNRELPLQLKCVFCVTGNKVEIKADILVPGFTSRKLGQIPCEDVMVRIPIPECWIYLFRVEKHFRYGSVKSAHRRTGKIKGIERFLGAVDNLEPQLMEATSGQAKYEHQHKAIVWRMPRLPKEGQGAYTTHQLVCRLALTSYDQIPPNLAQYCYVEFTMPATQVSHTTARSVSFRNHDSDDPPEKYVRNLSRHEYRVGIEHTKGEGPGAYLTATIAKPIPESTAETHEPTPADSDSDSSE